MMMKRPAAGLQGFTVGTVDGYFTRVSQSAAVRMRRHALVARWPQVGARL